jgi:hypothetical protein
MDDDGALRAPGPTTVSATTNNHPYHFVPTRASSRTYNLILFLHAALVLSNPEIGWSLKMMIVEMPPHTNTQRTFKSNRVSFFLFFSPFFHSE